MGVFFVLELGSCLWLTLIGVVSMGLAFELRPRSPAGVDLRQTFLVIVAIGCTAAVVSRAVFDWGVVAIAMLVTLGCGLIVLAATFGLEKAGIIDWPIPAISVIGGLTAFLAAVISCLVILPMVNDSDYSEEVLGTVERELVPLYDDESPLIERHRNADEYFFKYARQNGDPTGTRRGILDSRHITFLEEGDEQSPYAECNVTAMVKLDPVSGRPLNFSYDRRFRPIMLYVHQSDIATDG